MKTHVKEFFSPKEMKKTLGVLLGALIYAIGLNLFVVPAGVYSGGLMGMSQIIRTILTDYLHLNAGTTDIAGIINFIANLPILYLAYKSVGRFFFYRTTISMVAMTLSISLLPVQTHMILANDVLTSCIIGGILTGIGCGITLMMGGSTGGTDIIGIYFIKKRGHFSVGKVNLIVNCFIYAICLFLFNVQTVIYSVIYAAANSITLDKVHSQNINVEVIIITKKYTKKMQEDILKTMGRGLTRWNSTGAYTEEGEEILFIILSKYEINQLKQLVHQHDPNCFIMVNEGVLVDGNYTRKL